ncbi:MAG: hypothetical protein NTW19_08150, partial [Planctomycetota bacterium]|nr:hypothetical protein [Planctomycetota bacterium]
MILNEDNCHFFYSRKPDQMTIQGLHAWVDQYASTQVSKLFLCPNARRVNYRSQVWDAIWDGNSPEDPSPRGEWGWWVHNAWLL